MHNPPKVAKPEIAPKQSPEHWWIVILSIGLTVISGGIYAAIYPIIPPFIELFANFGADLPRMTVFILDTYPFYGLLFLIGFVPCVKLFKNRKVFRGNEKKLFSLVVLNFVLAFLLMGFILAGMYLPLFSMGMVV